MSSREKLYDNHECLLKLWLGVILGIFSVLEIKFMSVNSLLLSLSAVFSPSFDIHRRLPWMVDCLGWPPTTYITTKYYCTIYTVFFSLALSNNNLFFHSDWLEGRMKFPKNWIKRKAISVNVMKIGSDWWLARGLRGIWKSQKSCKIFQIFYYLRHSFSTRFTENKKIASFELNSRSSPIFSYIMWKIGTSPNIAHTR